MFGRRMLRLSEISTVLSALYGDLARTKAMETETKANLYLGYPASMSHGERQARAAHETVGYDTEIRGLHAQIEQLKEEQSMLRFAVEWDVGE